MLPKTILVILFTLLIAGTLAAQVITASLEGTVHDPTGAVIPNARIVATNAATNVITHVVSDSSGRFVIPSLQPGPYRVDVEAPGFKRLEESGITLEVSQIARLNLTMQLGDTTSTILVTAEAPLVDASDSTLGQVVTNRSIVNLPLNTRNSWSLVFLTPGAVGSVGSDFNNVNISINGGRPGDNAMMVDGIPSTSPVSNPIQGFTVFPSVDGVQEFKVTASNFSAEFGRTSGGIINLIYKSGTNQLHGTAYEFLRNSALDANSFFANAAGSPLTSFKRDQYGGSVGGPIVLPHVYTGKNKTFFFVDYEGLWQTSALSLLTTVPSLAERAGNFSQQKTAAGAPITIYDPGSTVASGSGFIRTPFLGNTIPINRWDPVAKNVLQYYPLPNQPGNPNTGANNFFLSGSQLVKNWQFDAKVDENINDKNRFFVRVSRRVVDNSVPQYNYGENLTVAQTGSGVHEIYLNTAIDYTWTVSPTFLVDIRAGFGRTFVDNFPRSLGFDPVQLGFPANYDQSLPLLVFPGFAVSGYQALGIAGNLGITAFQTYSTSINATKVFSRHVLKFGSEWRLIQDNVVSSSATDGSFTFDRSFTQGPNPNAATANAGDPFASFLLGTGNGSLVLNAKNLATTSRYYAWYIQDDWKVTPKLTLNVGLRYGLDVPYTERYNRVNLFDPTIASPLAGSANLPGLKGGLVFLGANGLGHQAFPTDRKNWDPRFGFAYQLARHTALRGAYGIFHLPSLTAASGQVGTVGYTSTTQFTTAPNGVTPVNYLSNPFPTGLVPVAGNSAGLLTGIGSPITAQLRGNNTVPYMQNWNLNIQQQLPGKIVVEAAYVGTRGVDLNAADGGDFNLNQLTPDQLALGAQLQRQVPNPFFGQIRTGTLAAATVPYGSLISAYPQFTSVGVFYPIGSSSEYHAFQLKVEKRFSSGLSFLLAYTGAKLIDDYSNIAIVGATAGIQNIYDRRSERTVSPNDVARSLVFSYVYRLPFGRGQRFGSHWNRFSDTLAGGWQINGITAFATGMPLALTTQNTSGSGSQVLRPNNNGQSAELSGSAESRLSRYFNTSVFSQPAAFTFGNTGRTLPDVRGPGPKNLDFSIFKNFHIVERASLQFRAEAFNLMNRVQFGLPNTNLSNPQFGVISTQVNTPRQLQFAFKLLF